jgi:threonine dehydratase
MAQAVGYVAKLFGVPARVVVVETASEYKIELMKRYGVDVEKVKLSEVYDYIANRPFGHCFIHPLYEYGLLDGYGTIALEILEEAPDIDTIFAPVGAGLLSVGLTLAKNALNPDVKVIGVQTENSPHYYNSFKKGEHTPYKYVPSICDGISVGQSDFPRDQTELVMETLDDMIIVSEDKVRDVIQYLALENNLVAEGAGAIALAAALDMPKKERGKSVCVLTGGGIDAQKLSKIILQ